MAKNPNQIIGSFVFRNEGDGCLTSKYQNADSIEAPFVECSKLLRPISQTDVFVGEYRTTWIQEGSAENCTLTIARALNNANMFSITWSTNQNSHFTGTGMLYGELLVGAYWD